MNWPHFISPYIKVDCPDGPRFILKNPEKAFSIIAPDWNARINAIINAYKSASNNLNFEVTKRFRSLVENLDSNYAELQAHYQAAYFEFVGNPCNAEANTALANANKEIRNMEFKLREIEINTELLMKLIKPRMKKSKDMKDLGFKFTYNGSELFDTIAKLVSEFHYSR